MGVTGGDVPEHDHIVDTGKSSFGLDELGHIQPGLARIMPEIGARIWKCYYAGKAGNQPLARFQLKEAVNLMEMGAFVRPKYEENMTKFVAEDVEQVKQAIEAKDWDKFEPALRWLVTHATAATPVTAAAPRGVSRPNTSDGPAASSVTVTSQAWAGPGCRPRLANQLDTPDPSRIRARWFQPWANMTTPAATRRPRRARFTAFVSISGRSSRGSHPPFPDAIVRVG